MDGVHTSHYKRKLFVTKRNDLNNRKATESKLVEQVVDSLNRVSIEAQVRDNMIALFMWRLVEILFIWRIIGSRR